MVLLFANIPSYQHNSISQLIFNYKGNKIQCVIEVLVIHRTSKLNFVLYKFFCSTLKTSTNENVQKEQRTKKSDLHINNHLIYLELKKYCLSSDQYMYITKYIVQDVYLINFHRILHLKCRITELLR